MRQNTSCIALELPRKYSIYLLCLPFFEKTDKTKFENSISRKDICIAIHLSLYLGNIIKDLTRAFLDNIEAVQ